MEQSGDCGAGKSKLVGDVLGGGALMEQDYGVGLFGFCHAA